MIDVVMYYLRLTNLVLGILDYNIWYFLLVPWSQRRPDQGVSVCVCVGMELPQKEIYVPNLNYTIKRSMLREKIEIQDVSE